MTTETSAEDDYGSFFDNLSALAAEKKPVPADFGATPAADPAPIAVSNEPVVEPVVAAADPVVEPVAAPVEPVVEPVVAPVEPVAEPKPDTEAILARIAAAMETRAQPAPAPQQPQPAPRLYSDDEVAALTTAEKDYPDLIKAVQLMLRGATAQSQTQTWQQLAQVLGPQLENMQAVQVDHQLSSLRQAIPDYDTVRDPVINWVRNDPKIPRYLRNAYVSVIEGGEVSEIADLVGTWRQATGASAQPTAAARTPAPAAKTRNELSEAAKQAAVALAPVVSQRTAVVTTTTPSDFDGAWDHFAAEGRK